MTDGIMQKSISNIRTRAQDFRNKIPMLSGTGTKGKAGIRAQEILSDFRSKAEERVKSIPILSERPLIQRATGNQFAGGKLLTGQSGGVDNGSTIASSSLSGKLLY